MRTHISTFVIACLLLSGLTATAQKLENAYSHIFWGIEQDFQPYIFKGYMLSGWMGMQKTRMRLTYAEANTPAFMRGTGIGFERTFATHLGVDFFFRPRFKGLWVGPSLGYWRNKIMSEDHYQRDFWSTIFSVSGGYNWILFKGFYICPFVSGHLRLTGNQKIRLGGLDYQPRLLTPEIGLKIGWRFGQ